jgi:hypothetical protein
MNKSNFFLAILAITFVLGITLIGCDDKLDENDEASFTKEGSSGSAFSLRNNSSYEINVTVKDSNYIKQSKTIPIKEGVYFSSLTPPVTVTYSPASKVVIDSLRLNFTNK